MSAEAIILCIVIPFWLLGVHIERDERKSLERRHQDLLGDFMRWCNRVERQERITGRMRARISAALTEDEE